LERFYQDHNGQSCVFIMMDFSETRQHDEIVSTLRNTLGERGLTGLRSDDRTYNENLLLNVLTYIWGCGSGIAVFERIKSEIHNPNVAFEVGYMKALRKPLLLLKDQNLSTLQSDLIGNIYRSFDTQNSGASIPSQIDKWLADW
jgi:hypothetical protein